MYEEKNNSIPVMINHGIIYLITSFALSLIVAVMHDFIIYLRANRRYLNFQANQTRNVKYSKKNKKKFS